MSPLTITRMRWALAAALLALLFCFCALARPSHGATWVHFQFTAPADDSSGAFVSGIGRYRMEAETAGVWDSVRIYSAPGVEGVPPQIPGLTCDLYVSQTVAPLTSRTYRIVSIDQRGNRSGSSDFVVVATGFPDTIAALSRPAGGFSDGFAFQRTGVGITAWRLRYGDTLDVHAVHLEELQRFYRARLCTLFGHWALRGVQQACP